MSERITGIIRRFVPERGWGIAHAYLGSNNVSSKFFVHVSNLSSKDKNAVLAFGTKMSFIVGPPRSEGELPAALEIEVLSKVTPAQPQAELVSQKDVL